MSRDWVSDIIDMHDHYGHTEKFETMNKDDLKEFLNFRIKFLQEELDELKTNREDPEEVVDALVDLCVVAIGTLHAFDIDMYEAWNEVLLANMTKKTGVKESRPNPLGLPDLMKPAGWEPPCHAGNHGRLTR